MVGERELSDDDLNVMIAKLEDEVKSLEKEHELLKFDLKEMQDINQHLSREIDRLYENISYLADSEPVE